MGNKPILIFVPGMFCHREFFTKMKNFFEGQGYQCLALTMPFHDRLFCQPPSADLAKMGILNYVEFLERVIGKLTQEYIIIGHSMGGLISMKTASLPNIHPKALILLAPAAPYGIFALRYTVLKSFYPVLTTPSFWKIPIALSYEQVYYSMLNRLADDEAKQIYRSMVWESGKAAFQMGFWSLDPAKATKVEPEGITCPIIIFTGMQDRITPYKVVKATANFLDIRPNLLVRFFEWLWQLRKGRWETIDYRRIKLVVLPEAGHWLLTELDPAKLLSEIELVSNL